MLLMLMSWLEMLSKDCGGDGPCTGPGAGAAAGVAAGEECADRFVMFDNGGSSMCWGIVMLCNACMVADGGVFSPRIALWLGRRAGVSLISNRDAGVGVSCRIGLTSASFPK